MTTEDDEEVLDDARDSRDTIPDMLAIRNRRWHALESVSQPGTWRATDGDVRVLAFSEGHARRLAAMLNLAEVPYAIDIPSRRRWWLRLVSWAAMRWPA